MTVVTESAPSQSGIPTRRDRADQDQQWRIHTIQVINWGGFEGINRLEFHPFGTLVTGASGCGKSTILDAYLALVMSSKVALNGASNQAEGRARSEGQRTPLSYMRGKVDADTDPVTGEEIDRVLRGRKRATWSVIAAEFRSDRGNRYTIFRTYFAAASVRTTTEVVMRMFTRAGVVDIDQMERLAADRFEPRSVKKALPGATHCATYATFAQDLFAALGIGANGDGAKALLMLAQIQAGGAITTVNDLYRTQVLERPGTYAKAQRAVEHFNNLESTYKLMQTAKEKADRLAPIVEAYGVAETSRAELERIDTVGISRDGDTPYLEWQLRTEDTLLGKELDRNRQQRTDAAAKLAAAKATEIALDRELSHAEETRRALGGDTLDELEASIKRLQGALETAKVERARLTDRVAVLLEDDEAAGRPTMLTSAATLAAATGRAETFLHAAPQAEVAARATRDGIQRRRYPLLDRQADVRADIATMSGKASRIDARLDERRNQLAAAAGMQPGDLPFVAELIDIATGQEAWRAAADSVLGGLARTLVVDRRFLAEFSRRIDSVRLSAQLRFEGVELHDHQEPVGDPDRISGRIVHKPSPFSHWIAAEISKRDALCVDDADGLNGPGYRVARSGQTRNGTSGTIGQSGRHSIIGFTNQDLLDLLAAEAKALDEQLEAIDNELAAHDTADVVSVALRRAHEYVRDAVWTAIDTAGPASELGQRQAARGRMLSADIGLQEIVDTIERLKGEVEEAKERRFKAKGQVEKHDETFSSLVDRQSEVHLEQERIEDAGHAALTSEQVDLLDQALAAVSDETEADHQTFRRSSIRSVARYLETRFEAAQQRLGDMHQQLGTIFASYLAQWPDPNLSARPSAYPDYKQIFDEILATGLHDRRTAWLAAVREWTAQDLLPLNSAMEKSLAGIEGRLDDINAILEHLPFGAGQDRLRISSRRLSPDVVASFRKDLRRLASVPSRELTEQQLVERFTELRDFISLIRASDDKHLTRDMIERNPGRDALLDVRRHIEIEAVRVSQTGDRLATYRRLSEKSGGETQELIAFILGSALRYRLGDEERSRPRFAPVFLDEGFIKADAAFAGRAVQAWQGLGFQLIIAAPLDKVSGLGEHMGTLATVGKSDKTGYAQIMKVVPLAAYETDPWHEHPRTGDAS